MNAFSSKSFAPRVQGPGVSDSWHYEFPFRKEKSSQYSDSSEMRVLCERGEEEEKEERITGRERRRKKISWFLFSVKKGTGIPIIFG